jgi:hypothetical protein
MPPRYAYWTILVDDQPTAFRSGSQDDLMPTFKRLQQKHPSAKMMWWQNGKLWDSRIDAQEAMRARGEIGRARDFRQRPALSERRPTAPEGRRESKGRPSERPPGPRERREERDPSGKLDWKPKGEGAPPSSRKERSEKPEWKPKGSFTPERNKFAAEGRESRRSAPREGGPDWKPKGSFKPERSAKPDWKAKGSFRPEGSSSRTAPGFSRGKPQGKSDWKPRGSGAPNRAWAPKADGKLEWKPKGDPAVSAAEGRGPHRSAERDGGPEKRKWVPKAEYKKSLGIEVTKDKNWRPGGEHKDPRQKYKDAKKAKWTKFKKNIRARSEGKPRKKNDE